MSTRCAPRFQDQRSAHPRVAVQVARFILPQKLADGSADAAGDGSVDRRDAAGGFRCRPCRAAQQDGTVRAINGTLGAASDVWRYDYGRVDAVGIFAYRPSSSPVRPVTPRRRGCASNREGELKWPRAFTTESQSCTTLPHMPTWRRQPRMVKEA